MTKAREASERRSVFGITGQGMHEVSDVRLDIPCWLLGVELSLDGKTFSDGL